MTLEIYSHQDLMQGRTNFNQFVPVIAHGDSWGSFGSLPSWLTGSLFRAMNFGKDVGVVNYAMPGQVLCDLPDPKKFSHFHLAMTLRGMPNWRAMLISGGGNDLIAWLRRSPGFDLTQRILRQRSEWLPANQGPNRYLSQTGWANLCTEMLAAYVKLDALRDLNFAGMVIITHVYDYMTPRFAPVIGGASNAWMAPEFQEAEIPKEEWDDVARVLIDWFHDFLEHQVKARIGGFVVLDTRGGARPAAPDTTGVSNDWANEIHLTREGYLRLAAAKCNAELQALAATWTTGEIAAVLTPPIAATLRSAAAKSAKSARKSAKQAAKQATKNPAKALKPPAKAAVKRPR